MIVCISDNHFFLDGIKLLLSETFPGKEVYLSDVYSIKNPSWDLLITPDIVTYIVDYSQADRALMFSLLEKKRRGADFNVIVIADLSLCKDLVDNILIDTVADALIEKKGCMVKLCCGLNEGYSGQLITRSIMNIHWAHIKKWGNLTHREIDMFPYIISGKRNKEISRDVNISQKTVSQHRRNIYAKLRVNTLANLFNVLSANPEDAYKVKRQYGSEMLH